MRGIIVRVHRLMGCLTDYVPKMKQASGYVAIIVGISGRMPMMLMTRFILQASISRELK